MAPPRPRRAAIAEFLARHPAERRRVAVAHPNVIRRALIERSSAALTRRAVNALLDRDPSLSAAGTPSPRRMTVVASLLFATVFVLSGLVAPVVAIWTTFFLVIGLFRLLLVDARLAPPPPRLTDADLPSVAVLVPIYREAEVVDDLVSALMRLDYPADRLDLRLIVEADDLPTRSAAERAVAGTPVDVVAVPPSRPRTKPKALDFALATVAAEIVTVYDAEDRPEPDQLRRAAAAFAAGPPELGVVQAALEIDHAAAARPWLVRQFEIEYAMLFRGLLPWLAERGLFLPLGGTSNHFRRETLVDVGGWDPHNVTEDADIAVRIARFGWRAGVIASTTREEAPASLRPWFAQRTRWMKGWLQTWFTHMRSPRRLHRELGVRDALAFHLLLAGQILSAATFLPSLVAVILQMFGVIPLFDGSDLETDVLALSALCAFATGLVGAMILAMKVSTGGRRRFASLDLVTMPFYWCVISLATYAAAIELVRRPDRWNKTTHGLSARLSGPGETAARRRR